MNIDTGLTIDQLKEKWASAFEESKQISTLTEDHTLAYLAEQAADKVIVESGTYKGASAYMMLRGGARTVHCVDPFMEPGSETATRKFLRPWIDAGRAILWTMRSGPASQRFTAAGLGPVDMVFVDDGHEEDEVKYDIDCWYPLLKSGGLICGHDLDPGGSVEKGVRARFPDFALPVPRLWAFIKP